MFSGDSQADGPVKGRGPRFRPRQPATGPAVFQAREIRRMAEKSRIRRRALFVVACGSKRPVGYIIPVDQLTDRPLPDYVGSVRRRSGTARGFRLSLTAGVTINTHDRPGRGGYSSICLARTHGAVKLPGLPPEVIPRTVSRGRATRRLGARAMRPAASPLLEAQKTGRKRGKESASLFRRPRLRCKPGTFAGLWFETALKGVGVLVGVEPIKKHHASFNGTR